MNRRMIWRNLIRSKVVSMTTILFIAAASTLLSLAAILSVNLTGAVGRLMEDAKTPHFMQMHPGDLDTAGLKTFAEANSSVKDFQVLRFLNIDNSQILLGKNSLVDNIQDNGVSVQSSPFDFLLDLDNKPVNPGPGELYVPVCYLKDGTAKAGDMAFIGGLPLMIAGFVRDSQMNSTLASSKRFIVNEEDYSSLEPFGNVEYLIEFRLNDLSELGAFEAAYSAARLPANGPALTWPLFQMISAVSDGILIAVIILIGILVIFIALLCVRFTLFAKIEDDYREIGVMKAIGIRISDIRRIYLAIYAAIGAAESILGFLLSLLLQKPLLESIRMNLGDSGNAAPALQLGLLGTAFIFLLIIFYVNSCLRRFRKISAVQAIQFGIENTPSHGFGTISLSKNKIFSVNFLLGLKDVLTRKRLYHDRTAESVPYHFRRRFCHVYRSGKL